MPHFRRKQGRQPRVGPPMDHALSQKIGFLICLGLMRPPELIQWLIRPQSAIAQRTSPPEAVAPLTMPIVVILALVVRALADAYLDPLAADVANVEIA